MMTIYTSVVLVNSLVFRCWNLVLLEYSVLTVSITKTPNGPPGPNHRPFTAKPSGSEDRVGVLESSPEMALVV